MKYMVPLCIVYIAEYFINQGLVCIYVLLQNYLAQILQPFIGNGDVYIWAKQYFTQTVDHFQPTITMYVILKISLLNLTCTYGHNLRDFEKFLCTGTQGPFNQEL